MNANTPKELAEQWPDEVFDFLENQTSDFERFEFLPRATEDALRHSFGMQKSHDVYDAVGLILLGDCNDSNPYCYLGRGPASGTILHLFHDGDTHLAFNSLDNFVNALEEARTAGRRPDDLREQISPADDQEALRARIDTLLGNLDDDDAWKELFWILPLVKEERVDFLDGLAAHENVFIRQGVAEYLEENPRAKWREIAESLAGDDRGQVARPAKAAAENMSQLET